MFPLTGWVSHGPARYLPRALLRFRTQDINTIDKTPVYSESKFDYLLAFPGY